MREVQRPGSRGPVNNEAICRGGGIDGVQVTVYFPTMLDVQVGAHVALLCACAGSC